MSERLDRRSFIRRSALTASAAGALTWQFEEQALLAQQATSPAPAPAASVARDFPMGRIGKLELSRLICGGNLISGFAHSRDLIYVSRLLKSYFTDEKVIETLGLCEAEGINAMILRVDDDTARIIRKYREQGGKLQWLAQCKLPENDRWADINRAVEAGAAACYVHGGVGDSYVAAGRVNELGEAVDYIRKQGVVSGIAGHDLTVHRACEKAGLAADFYMKTYNSKQYWSAGPMPRNDSVWEETPEETRAFMSEVEKPWIAYKVLGAGAIPPDQGFRYAFDGGADFICVGMFDFQVADDAEFARRAIARARIRERPWA
ncbi:MAG: hypothetical protein H7A46_04870 [Verrucomicrobiales bacterium]|nr:hypothetical protein [Verrucomicrobiales bacterium]